jgi:hypothetical protein
MEREGNRGRSENGVLTGITPIPKSKTDKPRDTNEA